MNYGNKNIRDLYFYSPYFAKNLISSIYGYVQRRRRYDSKYKSHLNFLMRSEGWSLEKLKEYQNIQTINFVNKSKNEVQLFRDNAVYRLINKIDDIKEFPIINKDILRREGNKIFNLYDKTPRIMAHTSGTTGKALIFPISLDCYRREYAFRALHYQWGNINMTDKTRIAICAGHPVAYYQRKKPPFWIYDYINNWLYLSSYHLSKENIKYYIQELQKFQPEMIHGYPSSIYLIAKYFREYGKGKMNLRAIYTSSETLLDVQRQEIEEVFGAKVFNWYGNSEMCANIVECEKGELHLKYEHSYVEILNEKDEDCKYGEAGRLVCTGFGNVLFPLIRYDIGDSVLLTKNQNSKCGRGGLLIDKVLGRREAYIITADGRYIGRLDHLFKDSTNIIEAQIYQKQKDTVVLRIVKNDKYGKEDEGKLMSEAVLRLGTETKIVIEHYEKLPRTKNGKYQFIVSDIEDNFNKPFINNI